MTHDKKVNRWNGGDLGWKECGNRDIREDWKIVL